MKAADLTARVTGATPRGDGWLAICPAHDDQKASLTFRDGEKGVLLKCQAGCQTEIVCERLGLTLRDLFFEPPPSNGQPARRIVKTYDYLDEAGALLFQVVRYEPKEFRQRRPNGHGGWLWKVNGVRRAVYRLPEIVHQSSVFIVEGEKDCDRLWALGVPSTTNAGGAGKWTDELTQQLKDVGIQRVVIIPDNDDPGRTHAEAVAQSCMLLGITVKIVVLPNVPAKGDISSFLDAGATVDELQTLVDATRDWTPEVPQDTATPPVSPGEPIRLTDVGNAQRFARQHGDRVRYCYPLKAWFVCSSEDRWMRDPGELVMQLAKETVRRLYDEARDESHDERRTKLAVHAVKSENVQRLQAMLTLAQSEAGIAVSPEKFDTDPWLFNVANGVIDLKTSTCRHLRRQDLISKRSAVFYNPSVTCPKWERFLTHVFQADDNLIAFIQQAIGYSLTGMTTEQVFFLLWGSGANGKSTFLKVLLALVGEYGLQTPADTFLTRAQDGRAAPDLARLQGSRIAVAIESNEGSRLAEGTLKQMTGNDRMSARRLYSDYVEFDPTHKVWFATNHKPRVRDNTHAMWRRVRLIPFDVQIPDEEQDTTLADKLLVELPGILNWALAGCRAWQRAGRLHTPEPVVAATQAYREEQDILDDFLRERTVVEPAESIRFSELRQEYVVWAKEVSDKVLSSKAFAAALSERGYLPVRRSNARYYTGLRLRSLTDVASQTPVGAPGGAADVDLD